MDSISFPLWLRKPYVVSNSCTVRQFFGSIVVLQGSPLAVLVPCKALPSFKAVLLPCKAVLLSYKAVRRQYCRPGSHCHLVRQYCSHVRQYLLEVLTSLTTISFRHDWDQLFFTCSARDSFRCYFTFML